VGEPVVGKARPGTVNVERWPVAPQANTLWTVTLDGPDALPLAAVHEARIEAEPEASAAGGPPPGSPSPKPASPPSAAGKR